MWSWLQCRATTASLDQPSSCSPTYSTRRTLASTVAPVTSTILDTPLFRVTVEPSRRNGLRLVSQIMVDKITTVRRQRLGQTIGRLEEDVMLRVSRALALWFGIAA